MKAIILIISVLISVLGLIAGQFLYPLIASWFDSWFDGSPTYIALFTGGPLFIIITILTLVLTKDKFIRSAILIPVFVSILATIGLLTLRFGESTYTNGYCYCRGELKNSLGITFIDSSCGSYWSRGINEFGQEVFVNAGYHDDWDYRKENDNEVYKYDYEIMVFDEFGNFIGQTRFSLYFDDEEEKFDFNRETKDFIETHTGISVYQRIG